MALESTLWGSNPVAHKPSANQTRLRFPVQTRRVKADFQKASAPALSSASPIFMSTIICPHLQEKRPKPTHVFVAEAS